MRETKRQLNIQTVGKDNIKCIQFENVDSVKSLNVIRYKAYLYIEKLQ